MSNENMATLVTHIRVKPNKNDDFIKWHEKVTLALTKFPGFISETVNYPKPPVQFDWVIFQHFDSKDIAKKWLQSIERADFFKQALSFLEGIDNVYIIENNRSFVTATFSTIIKNEDEKRFLDWNMRITTIESKFPGFIGHKLEKPIPGVNDSWTTIVTFDSNENLEKWLKSDERKKLIDELNEFKIKLDMSKTYSGFDFWFEKNKGIKRSIWKENMIVLLSIYPTVFFLSYIQNFIMQKFGLPFWFALFFANAASTLILAYILVPRYMKIFSWWINPPKELYKKYTLIGTLIILLLYVITLFICWLFTKITRV